MHDRLPRLFAATFFALLSFAPHAAAQLPAQPPFISRSPAPAAGLDHVDDASTPPKGLLRIRAIMTWSRYDARFLPPGVEPLGARFTAESLGVVNIPDLGAVESLVQTAAAQPFTLTMGRSRLGASAREEVLPIAFEYGVTNRFAVNVVVPVVRKRISTLFTIDTTGSAANVGPNPNRTSTAAQQANALVQTQFTNAAAQLQACLNNPSSPGCSSVVGREAEAQQLLQASQAFAGAVASLYGAGATTVGLAFVPTTTSAAQTSIQARIDAFNTSYQSFLGSSLISAVPVAAGGPAGPAELTTYLIDELGSDSINTQERIGIGDVEIGVKWRALDRPPSETRRLGTRLAFAGSLRLPTGSRQTTSALIDTRIGDGSLVGDARLIVDLQAGRVGLLTVGQIAQRFSSRDTPLTRTTEGWGNLQIAPRWNISGPLAVHGAYTLRYSDAVSDQLVGGGLSYSTLAGFSGAGRLPIEMRFTHLEAVKGDAGLPKFFRDQVEVRLYYRLRR